MIPVFEPSLGDKELAYVVDCVKSTWVSSLGEYVTRFEEGFAAFCGVQHGVAVANGTVALHLALATLDIGPGDEVILPTFTFVATANAVHYTGATPVLVDSEPDTWNMDPAAVAAAVTSRTRAILPVHVYGHPVDMAPILETAQQHRLFVVEDAAEAHGAEYRGRPAGSLGHVGCFSFYGNKIITTGEGGMLVTDDAELARRAAFLKDHAMPLDQRYWHPEIGFNYRLTNLQAALGVAQLERIEALVARKREQAALYNRLLANVPGLTRPPEAPWAKNVYWMYSVLVEDEYGLNRDGLAVRLRERGIDSRPFFHPIHTLPPYRTANSFPVAEELARKGLNLPSAATLTDEQIHFICDALREIGNA